MLIVSRAKTWNCQMVPKYLLDFSNIHTELYCRYSLWWLEIVRSPVLITVMFYFTVPLRTN